MPGDMQMQYAAVDRGRAAVADAVERLEADRRRIDAEVDGLLRSGWRGPAATAFDRAWSDWLAAAHDVRRGLAAMGELMTAVRQDFARRDEDTAGQLEDVAGRIVQRLG